MKSYGHIRIYVTTSYDPRRFFLLKSVNASIIVGRRYFRTMLSTSFVSISSSFVAISVTSNRPPR